MNILYVYVAFCLKLAFCADQQQYQNFTSPFRLISSEDNLLTIYYGLEPMSNSLLVYAEKAIGNFSINIKNTKEDVVHLEGEPLITLCRERIISNITTNSTSSDGIYNSSSTQPAETCYNVSFQSEAVYIGYSRLELYARQINDDEIFYIGSVLLRSIRPRRIVDTAYNFSVMTLVTIVMLAIGSNLDFQTIKEHLKKPKAPIIALISQFTTMPLIAYGIIWLMGYTGGKALGFFTLGCSPGGGTSNIYAKLANGDLSLSVTMTTLSTIVSLGMLPLWLYTLGATIPADEGVEKVQIPFLNILQSLALIVVPLAVGVLIKYKLPRVALAIKRWLNVLFTVALLTFLTLVIYVKFYIFVNWDLELIVSACCLPYGGYIFGGLIAWLCRFPWPLIKTISIETGMQSAAVCVLVVMSVSGQPDNDLALILPIASTVVAGWPFYIILPLYQLKKKLLNKNQKYTDEEKSLPDSSIMDEKFDLENGEEKILESACPTESNYDIELKPLNS
ncbi:hepatic sodium/bile acid cotransporter-like [Watersipora subatra]|uniref:hepatic sodium/bile acid cotransporter-like n=1 Tax=Watersipora subatra TaxID=2589382 RepID=UPI00355AE72D